MKRDELTLTKPFQLNQIRNSPYIKDEERDELVSKLEINIDEKIRVFNDQINEIQKQQDLISDTPIPEEDIQVTKLKKNNVKAKIKETSYDVKNKLRRKPSFDDIVEAIAFVTTIILENIAINNTKIEKLVNDGELFQNLSKNASVGIAKKSGHRFVIESEINILLKAVS
jgi:hypothetical protein